MPASLPITLSVAGVTGEIGTVDLPFTTRNLGRDNNAAFRLAVEVDHIELRRRIADLLRDAAKAFEDGATT